FERKPGEKPEITIETKNVGFPLRLSEDMEHIPRQKMRARGRVAVRRNSLREIQDGRVEPAQSAGRDGEAIRGSREMIAIEEPINELLSLPVIFQCAVRQSFLAPDVDHERSQGRLPVGTRGRVQEDIGGRTRAYGVGGQSTLV